MFDSDLLADRYEEYFTALCASLSLKINTKKNICGTFVKFLGIEINSEAMEARLPKSKLLRAKTWVQQTLQGNNI